MGIASIPTNKIEAKKETDSLVGRFLAKGGKISKAPYRAPSKHSKSLKDTGEEKPTNFSPREEAKKSAKAAKEREAYYERKRLAKMRREPFDESPPWES